MDGLVRWERRAAVVVAKRRVDRARLWRGGVNCRLHGWAMSAVASIRKPMFMLRHDWPMAAMVEMRKPVAFLRHVRWPGVVHHAREEMTRAGLDLLGLNRPISNR